MKKKKVLFMLHIPPPVHGSSVVGLAVKNSKIINDEFDGYYLNLLASKDVSQTGKISFAKIYGFFISWVKMMQILIFDRPQICYLAMTATGAAFFRDVLFVFWIKLFGLKRVYHLHNKGIINKKNILFYKICYKFIFKDSKVILLSEALYSDVAEFVDRKDVYICANGVPDPTQGRVFTRTEKTESEPVKLLYLSNLIETKGVNILIEACSLLQNKDLNFECSFIGGEGDINALEFNRKVSELGLANKIKYLGKKYGTEKETAFNAADIFAFPTYYPNECFPLVLLEAMSFSLPVISTFEGGISDIVDDGVTGMLVQQKDVSALANKLEKLISNTTLCLDLGKAGRLKFESEFTMDVFENRLLNILKSVANNN